MGCSSEAKQLGDAAHFCFCGGYSETHSIRVCCDEAVRLAELGCRGIIVYDLGVLSVLSEMRAAGQLPASMTFKVSSHCQVTNQYTARMYVQAGADSITTPHDLTVTMLGDIRALNPTVCLDVPIDVYKTKGGYTRSPACLMVRSTPSNRSR
jgi:pyruvate/oxaloacetate carboxyltransferase